MMVGGRGDSTFDLQEHHVAAYAGETMHDYACLWQDRLLSKQRLSPPASLRGCVETCCAVHKIAKDLTSIIKTELNNHILSSHVRLHC